MAVLNYNKKYFPNIEWAASQPVEKFIKHEKHIDNMSEAELREAHSLCVAAVAPEVKAKEPKPEDK